MALKGRMTFGLMMLAASILLLVWLKTCSSEGFVATMTPLNGTKRGSEAPEKLGGVNFKAFVAKV